MKHLDCLQFARSQAKDCQNIAILIHNFWKDCGGFDVLRPRRKRTCEPSRLMDQDHTFKFIPEEVFKGFQPSCPALSKPRKQIFAFLSFTYRQNMSFCMTSWSENKHAGKLSTQHLWPKLLATFKAMATLCCMPTLLNPTFSQGEPCLEQATFVPTIQEIERGQWTNQWCRQTWNLCLENDDVKKQLFKCRS